MNTILSSGFFWGILSAVLVAIVCYVNYQYEKKQMNYKKNDGYLAISI